MNSLFATAGFRVVMVVMCCLGVVTAPLVAIDCGAAGVPAECGCCEDPQVGCCAAKKHQPERPVPIAPVKTSSLRDLAPAPVTVIAMMPPVRPSEFPEISSGAAERAPHVARHSLLCVRTV